MFYLHIKDPQFDLETDYGIFPGERRFAFNTRAEAEAQGANDAAHSGLEVTHIFDAARGKDVLDHEAHEARVKVLCDELVGGQVAHLEERLAALKGA